MLSGFQCTDPYLINLPISIIEKVNSHNSIRHYCKLPLMQTLGQSQLVLLNNRGLSDECEYNTITGLHQSKYYGLTKFKK